jgi:BirA family transcriptional regulator, biotin operon repressor / biotin---[acetyl-CoA-carboxylase] ligase
VTDFPSRRERFAIVGSTNDVVRDWLAGGTPEVCVAIADEQSAGRGREGRSWVAPNGAALLLSLGFRPSWLKPDRVWRLAAVVSMAMADAAETVCRLSTATIRLKWPNDLVVEDRDGIRKLAGVLGESDGIGTDDPRAVIGIGVNGDWPRSAFPAAFEDSMTSLHEVGARPVDHEALLDAFLERLQAQVAELREGRFDGQGWSDRQVTTDRDVDLIGADGSRAMVRATSVDPESGALVVGDRRVLVGEVAHVRLAARVAARSGV